MRFYLIFGNGNGDTGPFVPAFDSLDILSKWVENGVDPADNVIAKNARVKASADKSPAGTAERPMCRYPAWPKYKGGNLDPNLASSFSCATE